MLNEQIGKRDDVRFEIAMAAVQELTGTPPGKVPSVGRLGAKLRGIRGRNSGGNCLDAVSGHAGANFWTVRPAKPTATAPAAPPPSPMPAAVADPSVRTRIERPEGGGLDP